MFYRLNSPITADSFRTAGYYCVIVGFFVVFQYHREKQFKTEQLNGRLQVLNAQIIAQLDSTGQVVLPQAGWRTCS